MLVDEMVLNAISNDLSWHDHLRINSNMFKGVSSWPLMVAPVNFMSDDEFVCASKVHLGMQVLNRGPCPMCGKLLDIQGDHAIMCKISGDIIRRHNLVQKFILDLCKKAQLQPESEVHHLIPDTNLRPADIWLPVWRGNSLALDVSIGHALQDRFHSFQLGNNQGYPICEDLNQKKIKKFHQICLDNGFRFKALTFDSFGAMEKGTYDFITEVAVLAAPHLSMSPSESISFNLQQLQYVIRKHISQQIIRRGGNDIIEKSSNPPNKKLSISIPRLGEVHFQSELEVVQSKQMLSSAFNVSGLDDKILGGDIHDDKGEVQDEKGDIHDDKGDVKDDKGDGYDDKGDGHDDEGDKEKKKEREKEKNEKKGKEKKKKSPRTPTPKKNLKISVKFQDGWWEGKIMNIKGDKMRVKFVDGIFPINWKTEAWRPL